MNVTPQEYFDDSLKNIILDGKDRRWAAKVLASCPATGGGVHRYLFVAALKLHKHFPEKGDLVTALAVACGDCGRDVPESEIWNAVLNSQPKGESAASDYPRRAPWPNRNAEKIQDVIKDGLTLAQLEASSPVRWSDGKPHTEEIIDILFPGNPLLCASVKKQGHLTRSRDEWRGFLANQQYVVPSPMSKIWGKTKGGKDSMRCSDNTGLRRFLVVEFDKGTFDEHAAVLAHLGKFAPLVMAVHSGNKSLHGWFRCFGEPDENVDRFFRSAVRLGADSQLWTRCQFVRMPDGRRKDDTHDNVRQRVIYFNPNRLNRI